MAIVHSFTNLRGGRTIAEEHDINIVRNFVGSFISSADPVKNMMEWLSAS